MVRRTHANGSPTWTRTTDLLINRGAHATSAKHGSRHVCVSHRRCDGGVGRRTHGAVTTSSARPSRTRASGGSATNGVMARPWIVWRDGADGRRRAQVKWIDRTGKQGSEALGAVS